MIAIKGVIGWDIIGKHFANMISRLSGDIDIEIDSPGGYVTDGISIFNALKRYDKGKVNIQVVGECSSMAAYIMLAGDTLKFEPNSIVVLHNPWSCGCGDYRAMLHEAEILEKMTKLYAGEFVKKGIFDETTIRAYMDSEKWFIGADDLKLLGEVIERDIPKLESVEKEAKAAAARNNIKAWQTRARKEFKENLEGVAALISELQFDNIAASNTVITQIAENDGSVEIDNTAQIPQQDERENKNMDIQELQKDHPEVYAAAVKLGEQKESSRINALMQFMDDDKETVCNAISSGKSIHDDEVFATLTRARINKNTLASMEQENPEPVEPKEPTHEPENPENVETDEAKAARIKKEADEIVAAIVKE